MRCQSFNALCNQGNRLSVPCCCWTTRNIYIDTRIGYGIPTRFIHPSVCTTRSFIYVRNRGSCKIIIIVILQRFFRISTHSHTCDVPDNVHGECVCVCVHARVCSCVDWNQTEFGTNGCCRFVWNCHACQTANRIDSYKLCSRFVALLVSVVSVDRISFVVAFDTLPFIAYKRDWHLIQFTKTKKILYILKCWCVSRALFYIYSGRFSCSGNFPYSTTEKIILIFGSGYWMVLRFRFRGESDLCSHYE